MRRGDIHLVDFEPTRGSEADKRRPAVIVSSDASNAGSLTASSSADSSAAASSRWFR